MHHSAMTARGEGAWCPGVRRRRLIHHGKITDVLVVDLVVKVGLPTRVVECEREMCGKREEELGMKKRK